MNDRLKTFVAEHFSSHAEDWRIVYDAGQDRIDKFYSQNLIDRKTAVLNAIDGYSNGRPLKILDVGCGPGILMDEVLQRGHSVAGVDISREMQNQALSVAKKYAGRAVCMQGDIESLPFVDNAFDAVMCIGVLSYLHDDRKSIAEMSRVVRPGGLVIVALPNLLRLNVWFDPYYYLYLGPRQLCLGIRQRSTPHPLPTKPGTVDRIMRKYRPKQLSAIFRSQDLLETDCRGIGYGPFTLWRKAVFSTGRSLRISQGIERLSSRKGLTLLSSLANHWVICLRKGTRPNSDELLNAAKKNDTCNRSVQS